MFRRSMKCAVAVAGLASLVAVTSAGAAGEKWIVRAGLAQVNPNDSSSDLYASGFAGAGNTVSVGNATGLAINATYMFAPNMGVEVLGSLPFTHDIEGSGGLAGAGKIGETKQLPPTVLFVIRGNDAGSGIHPYVGVGLNYTMFFSEETTGALAGTKLALDDSFGPAFEAGADFDINDRWFVNASLWYMNIKTTASVNGTDVVDVKINPIAAILGVGMKF